MKNTLEVARKCEGVMQKLRGLADELSVFVAEITEADSTTAEAPPTDLLQAILDAVATYYGVAPKEILGTRQIHRVTVPRHTVMWLCRKHAKMGVEELGRVFGRDHSTVVVAIRKMDEQARRDDSLRHAITKIELTLKLPLSFNP